MEEYPSPQPAIDFDSWVVKTLEKYTGHDLRGKKTNYIPHFELEKYWQIPKITKVLQSYAKPLPFNPIIIRSDYLRIFSALVWTGMQHRLLGLVLTNNLDDSHWPKVHYPSRWPLHHQEIIEAFETVKKQQWTFFPLAFKISQLSNAEYENERILPIAEPETILEYGTTSILKISIHDDYNSLLGPDTLNIPNNPVVFKSYCLNDNADTYTNEVEALTLLKYSISNNLIAYYGSFRQGGRGYVILEFANGGSLFDYFDQISPPTTAADINLFWGSLLDSLVGLHCIHQLVEISQGFHQDIKPANILLMRGSSGSPYEFIPKIADFGLFSHARKKQTKRGKAKVRNKYGNQRYSAPEVSCSRRNKMKVPSLSFVEPDADIFSMGAVLSDAAAWVAGGKELRDEYLKLRKAAHANLKGIRGTDYQGCFHAGSKDLAAVSEMHDRIKELCRSGGEDQVTPAILDIVQKSMLRPEPSERQQASALFGDFRSVLEPNSPCVTQSPWRKPVNVDGVVSGDASPPTNLGSIPQINGFFSGRIPDPMVKELVDKITLNLRDRDQFFFVDDSTSMHAYRDVVLQGFEAIAHIAKRLDPNKVELAFASRPTHVYRARRTKSLVEILRKHEFQNDSHLMEDKFEQLIENQVIRKLPLRIMGVNVNPISRKPLSIYVFTDGNWGDDPQRACRVERPVKALIKKIKKRELKTHQVTLHFIRFGDSKQGGRHLEYLDRFGENEDIDFDIVDVKTISSDFKTLIYGPLSHYSDRSEEAFFQRV